MRYFRRSIFAMFATFSLFFLLSTSSSATPSPAWHWPIQPPHTVVKEFAPPAHRWLPGHRGVDLACPAPCAIYAPAAGTVTVAGKIVNRGVVVITHDQRRSTFEPVIPLVVVGDQVSPLQPIALLSPEGDNTLKWGVKISSDSYLNPLDQLIGHIVLKPWR